MKHTKVETRDRVICVWLDFPVFLDGLRAQLDYISRAAGFSFEWKSMQVVLIITLIQTQPSCK